MQKSAKVNDPHVEKAKKAFSLRTEDVAQRKCSCICPVGLNEHLYEVFLGDQPCHSGVVV
jgi:hypothetical protein